MSDQSWWLYVSFLHQFNMTKGIWDMSNVIKIPREGGEGDAYERSGLSPNILVIALRILSLSDSVAPHISVSIIRLVVLA